jgi:hypothetical protein
MSMFMFTRLVLTMAYGLVSGRIDKVLIRHHKVHIIRASKSVCVCHSQGCSRFHCITGEERGGGWEGRLLAIGTIFTGKSIE